MRIFTDGYIEALTRYDIINDMMDIKNATIDEKNQVKTHMKNIFLYLIIQNKFVLPSLTDLLPGKDLGDTLSIYRAGKLHAFNQGTDWSPVSKGTAHPCPSSNYVSTENEPIWFMPKPSPDIINYLGIQKGTSNYGVISHRTLKNIRNNDVHDVNSSINLLINMNTIRQPPGDQNEISKGPNEEGFSSLTEPQKLLIQQNCITSAQNNTTLLSLALIEHFNRAIVFLIFF